MCSAELLKQIDKMCDDYLGKVRGMPGEQRKEQLNNIQKLFNQNKKFSEEKVQLALQTYEMVKICLICYVCVGHCARITGGKSGVSVPKFMHKKVEHTCFA